ncbi:MAG: hypothetical protein V3W44_05210 [Dehalococcoidales bacterium]
MKNLILTMAAAHMGFLLFSSAACIADAPIDSTLDPVEVSTPEGEITERTALTENSNAVIDALPGIQSWVTIDGHAMPGELTEINTLAHRGGHASAPARTPGEALPEELLEVLKDAPLAPDEKDPSVDFLAANDGEIAIHADGRDYLHTFNLLDYAQAAEERELLEEQTGSPPDNPLSDDSREREDEIEKSWSNGTDSRVRRGYADGYSVNSYRMMADYGGCSAIILHASSTRVWALTAAHCLFTNDAGATTSNKLVPRRDHSNGSNTKPFGSWSRSNYVYNVDYLNNECASDWDYSSCAQWDIVFVRFVPSGTTSTPGYMGRGQVSGSYLSSHDKYRRGYPSCSHSGAPSSCTNNTLYGDGKLSTGEFAFKNSANWYRIIHHSSDTNKYDSGSGMYYYKDSNQTRAFGVHVGGTSGCFSSCSSGRPNYTRRITPTWYNVIANNQY